VSPATKPEKFLINMLAQSLLTDGVLNLKILFLAPQIQFEVVKNLLIAAGEQVSHISKIVSAVSSKGLELLKRFM
jgi:hypothetical protein